MTESAPWTVQWVLEQAAPSRQPAPGNISFFQDAGGRLYITGYGGMGADIVIEIRDERAAIVRKLIDSGQLAVTTKPDLIPRPDNEVIGGQCEETSYYFKAFRLLSRDGES